MFILVVCLFYGPQGVYTADLISTGEVENETQMHTLRDYINRRLWHSCPTEHSQTQIEDKMGDKSTDGIDIDE